MKTCYVNKANGMRRIVFVDGSTQFLVKGESFVSSRNVRKTDEGIDSVSLTKTTRTRKSKQETE